MRFPISLFFFGNPKHSTKNGGAKEMDDDILEFEDLLEEEELEDEKLDSL